MTFRSAEDGNWDLVNTFFMVRPLDGKANTFLTYTLFLTLIGKGESNEATTGVILWDLATEEARNSCEFWAHNWHS